MKPFPPYSFLEQAAAEARAESRRYWQKGGAADRASPVHPQKWWKVPNYDKVDEAIRRMNPDRRRPDRA